MGHVVHEPISQTCLSWEPHVVRGLAAASEVLSPGLVSPLTLS